jgi:hypothetical protein
VLPKRCLAFGFRRVHEGDRHSRSPSARELIRSAPKPRRRAVVSRLQWLPYLQVYCDALVDDDPDLVVDVVIAAAGRNTFVRPRAHFHRDVQKERITHWVTAAIPSDAPERVESISSPYPALPSPSLATARKCHVVRTAQGRAF